MWLWLRNHPFIVSTVAVGAVIGEWFLRPIAQLNVERWAESQGADKYLSDRLTPERVAMIIGFYDFYIAPYFGPYLLGFATCALLFGVQDWRGRRRLSDADTTSYQTEETSSAGDTLSRKISADDIEINYIPENFYVPILRPDYLEWDRLNEFPLWQAACLWIDFDPKHPN